MKSNFTVVIPTTGNSKTIFRTLSFLKKCKIPHCLNKTIIVENGPNPKGDTLLSDLTQVLNPQYIYVAEANKSNALNVALKAVNDGLVVFFDDDIRIHEDTLMAYGQALDEGLSGCFFAGPIGVDYEALPYAWLVPHLPPSAKGWHLGDERKAFMTPDGMGANWAAFVSDLKEVGPFDSQKGPGSGARGQETDMQVRLINHGKKGLYLPDAKVWHYVPVDRSSPSWLLKRKRESGRQKALNCERNNRINYLRAKLILFISIVVVFIMDVFRIDIEIGFKWRVRKYFYKGMLDVLAPFGMK